MDKVINNIQKNKKIYIILIFVMFFFVGFFCERKVGVYNDEFSEQKILKSNIMEYARVISDDNDIVDYFQRHYIIPISKNSERDHGVAMFYAFTPLLYIENFSGEILSFLWHTYTYILFFFGVIFFYKIIKYLFKSDKIAMISSMIYMFSPRIFADGLYNNKDIVLLSLVLGTIYFGIRFINNKTYKSAIILGIVAAFTFNVKIIGLFVFGIIGLFYLINYIKNCIKSKKWLNKELYVGLTAIFIMCIVYLIITPAIWGDGFKLIDFLKWNLSQSSKFRWNGRVLFDGKIYDYSKNQSLPFYYLPKMILITIPIYVSILFFTGLFYIINNFMKKKDTDINYYFIMIFIIMFVPLMVDIITRAKIYNGWRHFYFLYGPYSLISIYGFYNLLKIKKFKKYLYVTICSFIIFYMFGCMHYGINGTAYFNIISNHRNLDKIHHLDYYGVAAKQVLEEAIENKKQDVIYVYTNDYGFIKVSNNYKSLSNIKKKQIVITDDEELYKNWKKDNKEVYVYYTNFSVERKYIKGLKKKYSINAWGNDVAALYE